MPLIESSYHPPVYLQNPHFQSIYPFVFRQHWTIRYERERLTMPDGDFLDLDWSKVPSKRLAILSHGLEGHSKHSYILGMVKALNRHGISALAWNLRGCSGDLNLKEHFYHGGMSEDLQAVIDHVKNDFDEIYLIGFSLGGNMTLKYLGEYSDRIDPKIKCGIAFSAPIDLKSCVPQVNADKNWIYFKKFIHSAEQKLHAKSVRLKLSVPIEKMKQVKSFKDLDDWFTAPSFGFENAEELWGKTSSIIHLENISTPTLLVSAKDDPILGPECYPFEIAEKSKNFYFESPEHGGHVGFMALNLDDEYWSETRTLQFIEEHRFLS